MPWKQLLSHPPRGSSASCFLHTSCVQVHTVLGTSVPFTACISILSNIPEFSCSCTNSWHLLVNASFLHKQVKFLYSQIPGGWIMCESKCIFLVLLYVHHLLVSLLSSFPFPYRLLLWSPWALGKCLPAKHIQVGGDSSHVISRWHGNILGRGYSWLNTWHSPTSDYQRWIPT